jgi:hypothetical protein
MTDKEEMGASLFSRTLDIMENDPLEEIFALNMGDFVSEFLISDILWIIHFAYWDLALKMSMLYTILLQKLLRKFLMLTHAIYI